VNTASRTPIYTTRYDRSACQVGVVHLGFGAFHRAHQAVYIDDYMNVSGDLRWGIAAVNLRGQEADTFEAAKQDNARHDGFFLKSISAAGEIALRRVRAHTHFEDWSVDADTAEALLTQPNVHLVTITVTESGYYTDPEGNLNLSDPIIAVEVEGGVAQSVYGYLRAALTKRAATAGAPLTVACCDNIRQNGKMLRRNLAAYLVACGDQTLADWVDANVAFPCSCYLAALEGLETFDEAMRVPALAQHFNDFEMTEVLPAITLDLPFSKKDYVAAIATRFGNQAIGDTVARICADGMAKFPIFIRPTLEGCLKQGHMPIFAIRSIASWHVFATHVAAGKIPFKYVEPSWDLLRNLLGTDAFTTNRQLWGDLPETYPEFAEILRREISELENTWPV